jgi:hypothetical protein
MSRSANGHPSAPAHSGAFWRHSDDEATPNAPRVGHVRAPWRRTTPHSARFARPVTLTVMPGLPTAPTDGLTHGGFEGADGAAPRVAVVFERGHAGTAALREAAERASAGAELSIVTLAPQARAVRRAGGEGPYNVAIRHEAQLELHEARDLLGSVATRATFNVLSGCPQPPLASWVAQHGFDLVVLPRQRLTPGGNYFAKSLRKETSAEVLLVR